MQGCSGSEPLIDNSVNIHIQDQTVKKFRRK